MGGVEGEEERGHVAVGLGAGALEEVPALRRAVEEERAEVVDRALRGDGRRDPVLGADVGVEGSSTLAPDSVLEEDVGVGAEAVEVGGEGVRGRLRRR
jgi:hypothetical protein